MIDQLCSVDLHPFLVKEKAHDTTLAALPNWADTDTVFSISKVKQLALRDGVYGLDVCARSASTCAGA